MKRYWLFAGIFYYPEGGMEDLVKVSDDEDELKKEVNDNWSDKYNWYHIYDSKEQKITSQRYCKINLKKYME